MTHRTFIRSIFARTGLTSRYPLPGVLCAAALCTGMLAASPALARPEMAGGNAADRFALMDADKDGKVTREEFFAAQPQMKEAAFLAIDEDKDGSITLTEWQAFTSGHARGEAQPGGMPPMSGMSPAPEKLPDQAGKPAGNAGKESRKPGLIMPPETAR